MQYDHPLSGSKVSIFLQQKNFKDLYLPAAGYDLENLVPFGNDEEIIVQYVNLSPFCIELVDNFNSHCDIYLIGLITKVLNTPSLDLAHLNTINSRLNLATTLSKQHAKFNNLLNDCKSNIALAKQLYNLICSIALLLKAKHANTFFQKISIKSSLANDANLEEIQEWVDFISKISLISPTTIISNAGVRNLFLSKSQQILSSSQLVNVFTDILYNLESINISCVSLCKIIFKHLGNIYPIEQEIEILNHSKLNTIDSHSIYKTIYILSKYLITYKDNLIDSIHINSTIHQSVIIYSLNQLIDVDEFCLFRNKIFTSATVSKGVGWILLCHLIEYVLNKSKASDLHDGNFFVILEKYPFSHGLLAPYKSSKLATFITLKSILKQQINNYKFIPDVKTLINSRKLDSSMDNDCESDDDFITNIKLESNSQNDSCDLVFKKLFNMDINHKTICIHWLETLELYAINKLADQIDYVKATAITPINGLEVTHAKCLFACYLSPMGFNINFNDLTLFAPEDFFKGDPNIGYSIIQIIERYWLEDLTNSTYKYILSHLMLVSGLIDLENSTIWLESIHLFYKTHSLDNIVKIQLLSDLFFLGAIRPLESIVGVEFESSKSSNQKISTGLQCSECILPMGMENISLLEHLSIRILWHLLSSLSLSCDCDASNYFNCKHEYSFSSVKCQTCKSYSNILVLGNRFNLALLKSHYYSIKLLIHSMRLDLQFEGRPQELWNKICYALVKPRIHIYNNNIYDHLLDRPSTCPKNHTLDPLPKDVSGISAIEVDIPGNVLELFNKISNLDIYFMDKNTVNSFKNSFGTEWDDLLNFAVCNYNCSKLARDVGLQKVILLSTLKYLPDDDLNVLNNSNANVWREWPAWPLHLPNIPGLNITSEWLDLDKERLSTTLDNLYVQKEKFSELCVYDLNMLVCWYVGKLYWARVLHLPEDYKLDHLDYITSQLKLSVLKSTNWYYQFALGPLKVLLVASSTDIPFNYLAIEGITIYYELLNGQYKLEKEIFVGHSQLLILLEYLFRLMKSETKINSLYTVYLSEAITKIIHGADILFPIITRLLLSKRAPDFDSPSLFYPLWYYQKAMKQARLFFLRILSKALNGTDGDVVKYVVSKLHIPQLLHSFSIAYDHLDPTILHLIDTIITRHK